MMSFFSGFSWRILLIYALIISSLGAYSWKFRKEYIQRNALYIECLQSQKLMEKTALKNVGASVSNIIKKSNSYYNEYNLIRYQQAQRIETFCEQHLKLTTEAFQFYSFDSLDNSGQNNPDYTIRGKEILSHLRILVDSLRIFIEDDSLSSGCLDQFFSKEQFSDAEQVMEHGSNAEKSLLLSSLGVGLLGVSSEILRQIDNQIPTLEEWINAFMPVLICKNNCIRAGDYFEADFFAIAYSTHSENFQLLVNGETVPFDHGVGHIKKAYAKPGLKMMVEIRAPATPLQRPETYKKEFIFNICD